MNQSSSLLPTHIRSIKHTDEEIKRGQGLKAQRIVFQNVEYDSFEKEQIVLLLQAIKQDSIQLPKDWKESDTIRFLYSGQFNFTKCLENIKKHINWLMDPFYHGLTTQSQRMLTDGMIYQFGVDKKMRPVIYFNIRKINAELKDVDSVIQAICFLLTQVRKTMLFSYHVETWQVVMDIDNLSLFNLPLKAIGKILEITQINFCTMMHNLFIIKPSFIVKTGWNLIKQMCPHGIDNQIKFIETKDYHLLLEHINADQLEVQYGGDHPNIVNFWPFPNLYERRRSYSPPRLRNGISTRSIKCSSELDGQGVPHHMQNSANQGSQFFSFTGNTHKFINYGELEYHSLSAIVDYPDSTNIQSYQMQPPQTDNRPQQTQMCCSFESCNIY